MPKTISALIVGECWTEEDERRGSYGHGIQGSLLRGIMRQVGLDTTECHFTSVLAERPPMNKLQNILIDKDNSLPNYPPLLKGKYFPANKASHIARLHAEIDRLQPRVIVALGNTALWALTKKTGIKKHRGSPLMTHDNRYKVLPTWEPDSVFANWELRVVMLADFEKVKRESYFPELRRPSRLLYLDPSIEELYEFYEEFLRDEPFLSVDIETKNLTITEVGIGNAAGTRALVVPFWRRAAADGNYWPTAAEEKKAWLFVKMVCENHETIGQNFSYDMQYFWRTMGITCPKFAGDTMLLHHALQPELEKGLGFLGSIYTNEPSWKFMRQEHFTLKKGDD